MGDTDPLTEKNCAACRAHLSPLAKYCSECGSRTGGGYGSLPPLASLPPGPDGTGHHAAAPAGADPLIGAIVADRYRIQALLGRGGMGVVYKVEHAKIGKIMALKLLTGELARSRETVRRFKREALMVSRLSHPNTVQVFDYGSAGGLTYLAMEYLSGQDLGAALEHQGPMGFSRLAPILLGACGSLREAHGQGIVHRDLKPENLYLIRGPNGEELVKVLDFGLAKLRENRELNEVTSSGMIVGTPYYMPPEQVRGEDVDQRGDIYALGALMYTCLTGIPAFDAPTPVAVLTMQLTEMPRPPDLRFPHLMIPPGVSDIVMKALAKDPAERFQSIEELVNAIEGELRGTSFRGLTLPESGYYAKAAAEGAATRDEVAGYERRLRRWNYLAAGLGVLTLGGLSAFGYHLYAVAQEPPAFDGREREPNQEPSGATAIPNGIVVGQLGARFNKDAGDRDFYRFTFPGKANDPELTTTLSLLALPNIPLRVALFREGSERPFERLATGSPGESLKLEQIRVRPGTYLALVEQDVDDYWEGTTHYLQENVSDDYKLTWRPRESADPGLEQEPNSERSDASLVGPGRELRGDLGFARDRDVVCVAGATGAFRFHVDDAVGGARPIHAVLQVTPLGGANDKIPVRVHSASRTIKINERDQLTPFVGTRVTADDKPCLQLELVPNPWATTPHPLIAPPSAHQWVVRVEPLP